MATLLVTLYEYSPLFHVALVSLCFLVTAAIVLGWFGFDVPVILLSYDETEVIASTPEKRMIQETNPFSFALGSGQACVNDGVSLRTCCLEPCVLSCFWGCEVSALQAALHTHQQTLRLTSSQHFLEALHLRFHYHETFKYPLHLEPLFMSAEISGPPYSEKSSQPAEAQMEGNLVGDESDWSEEMGRNCVICQNAAVNRVLLPCRHACVCDNCMLHFQHCPICRAFVLESFSLRTTAGM
ncbi:cell growth regulator with RING finger domain protein 1 isoform X5 [Fundulus heteroclitus]|uniref:cell growth regulator with RING finger domain protein 1 isoform X5 n=1 Tax=Fundulus heteroclitus TaxID=8078 RepID=UPI00079ED99C|nr:cell growth regulator with RING finger domain protein 1 isoform X5 [Fundulus heteroclitus]